MRPLPAALACCVAAASSSSAEEGRPPPPTAVRIDFGATAYPPLTKKWGGVEHPQWDTVTSETEAAVAANAARQTPMVLGVVQLGQTMSNDTTPIFARDPATRAVRPVLAPAFRRQRALRRGVRPLLQFDGCPTPIFDINSSSARSDARPTATLGGRYYPMCVYSQLDELARAFAAYGALLHETDGLPTAWSFWPEPEHTLSGASTPKEQQFERCEPPPLSAQAAAVRSLTPVALQTSTCTCVWRRRCARPSWTIRSRAGNSTPRTAAARPRAPASGPARRHSSPARLRPAPAFLSTTSRSRITRARPRPSWRPTAAPHCARRSAGRGRRQGARCALR